MRKSVTIALTSVFAALHVVLYLLSVGLWRNWAIYIEPLEGVILGPWAGLSAALLGSIIGRAIKPDVLWMFGIVAEPLGVLAAGFLAKGKWKPVVVIFVVMLSAYFLHPLGRTFPLWTILDILVALVLIYPVARFSRNLYEKAGRLPLFVVVAFVGTVTDALTRIFILIPAGVYTFLGWPDEVVRDMFMLGAVYSYIEDVQVIVVSFVVGVPILLAIRKIQGFKFPLT